MQNDGQGDEPMYKRGQLAKDRGRTGRVMDIEGNRVWLRPPGGGREWDAPRERVRPVPEPSATDALRPRLREVNARSRRGRWGDFSG
ncbi:hypothetical protein ACL02R_27275 [Streptomyces sp. MS19]|uniref:hypothetical protein n=1 Tax=Streptomyces sp. MS19 TaxID=3385972 RepID=UPI0039A212A6